MNLELTFFKKWRLLMDNPKEIGDIPFEMNKLLRSKGWSEFVIK